MDGVFTLEMAVDDACCKDHGWIDFPPCFGPVVPRFTPLFTYPGNRGTSVRMEFSNGLRRMSHQCPIMAFKS